MASAPKPERILRESDTLKTEITRRAEEVIQACIERVEGADSQGLTVCTYPLPSDMDRVAGANASKAAVIVQGMVVEYFTVARADEGFRVEIIPSKNGIGLELVIRWDSPIDEKVYLYYKEWVERALVVPAQPPAANGALGVHGPELGHPTDSIVETV